MKNLTKFALRKGLAAALKASLRKKKAAAGKADLEAPEAEAAPQPLETLKAEPAPCTPEAEAAAEAAPAPEPLWPAAGVKVAVGVEDLMHCLRLGETGVSEGAAPNDPDEVVVKLSSSAVLAPMRIPRSLLVPLGAPMSAMRIWDKCNEQMKRELLHKAGVRDPRDEVLPTTASVRLAMWGEYMPYGLKLGEDCKCKFVPPAFVKAYGDYDELQDKIEAGEITMSYAEIEEVDKRQGARFTLLQEWWRHNEVLLVCVCVCVR